MNKILSLTSEGSSFDLMVFAGLRQLETCVTNYVRLIEFTTDVSSQGIETSQRWSRDIEDSHS